MKTVSILLVLLLLAVVLVGCTMQDSHDHGDGQVIGAKCPKCGAELDEKNYCKRCLEYIGDQPK